MAFENSENMFYINMQIENFDLTEGEGKIVWEEYVRRTRPSNQQAMFPFVEAKTLYKKASNYKSPRLPFRAEFITPRTLRLSFYAADKPWKKVPDLMIPEKLPKDNTWIAAPSESGVTYKSGAASLEISYSPMEIILKDAEGKTLTQAYHLHDNKALLNCDARPFSFVRKATDSRRQIAASFTLSPGERIYGCGESFTGLNKRGQKIDLWTQDAAGAQSRQMYKPIPFYMSSRGYGVFVHTSHLTTFDFGSTYDGVQTIYSGEDDVDLFVFIGSPKEILTEYTNLTGRSPMPPLWSFGLWMSRITYKSEEEVREVAEKMRDYRIPCDVIHIDTGWFEKDWLCDYKFSADRFDDPKKMMADLKQKGFRVSLWQLPYLPSDNPLYREALDGGYAVKQTDGGPPTDDAVIDISNPKALAWYQGLLRPLFDLGVSAIKVDFGEGAPLYGAYASGGSGLSEHNLYPLRYNKAVFDVTKESVEDAIIWARSAWAGSQRYPVHWGGDAENTDNAMLATLRAGLSFGLSGFSFWSHDIGGFSLQTPRELYARWLPFGMLTSHSRCHGVPPKEPWAFDDAFVDEFRKAVELKYKLMPYIIEQARDCCEKGHPLVRTLFFEFPEDNTAWFIEDQYMFGEDMLVAPLFEENVRERNVYVPEGSYVDYQTEKQYEGGRWYKMSAADIPVIILVKKDACIRTAPVSQHTDEIDPAAFTNL